MESYDDLNAAGVHPRLDVDLIAKELSRRGNRRWFDIDGRGELYLRRSRRELESEERESLDVTNVEVDEDYQRRGILSTALAVVEEAAARMELSFVLV